MFKKALVAAISVVSLTNGFFTTSVSDDTEAGMPGALQLFLNVNSMNTLISDMSKALPYFVFKGKTFSPDIDVNLGSLELKIEQVTISDMKIGDASMAFVGDSDVVRTTLSNMNITLAIDSVATGIVVPLKITELRLVNVTMQLDLSIDSSDQLTWQLHDALILELESFSFTCAEKFWQKKMDLLMPEAQKLINYGLKFVQGAVTGLVDVLNTDMMYANPNTFVFDISPLGVDVPMQFNITTSKAPEFSNEKGEILIHVNGDFVGNDISTFVTTNQEFADYAGQKQKEQLWIHQSLVDSALYSIVKTLSGEKFQEKIELLMPELQTYYGMDAECSGLLTFPKEANSQPVTMNTVQGIVIGDEANGGLNLNLAISCAKAGDEQELSVVLNTGVSLIAKIDWDNFVFALELDYPEFQKTTAISQVDDLVLNYHRWDDLLTATVKDITDDFNIRWSTPIDLKTKRHDGDKHLLIKQVAGVFRETILSPYVADEFLLIGFKMIMDK